MSNEIQHFISQLIEGRDLTADDTSRAFQIMMLGGATPAQMAALLVALRMRGETVEEIVGAARTMRSKMQKLKAPEGTIDTCGTGGDARGTLNISTAVAIVVAACGVPVAKHGNRSVSSHSGSADVLTSLGVNINADFALVERSLNECNLCFMMAPRFHPAMRHVAPIRQELGLRTIFNVLGPLVNPAEPKRQLVGVYSKQWVRPIAEALSKLGSTHAWVVHGSDGLDELTLTGPSFVTELKDGNFREFEIVPEALGLETITLDQIKGKTPDHNARAIMAMLTGQKDAYRNVVVLNAGAALTIAGKTSSIREGIEMASDAIDSAKAKETLATLAAISQSEVSGDE